MARIILWSSDFSGQDGQSIVTRFVACKFGRFIFGKCLYKAGGAGALLWVFTVFRLWWYVCLSRRWLVYVVASRSALGGLRDVPALVLGKFGFSVFVHVHGSDVVDLLRHPTFGKIFRWLYSSAKVILPSSHLARPLIELGLQDCTVIENFFEASDTPVFDSAKHYDWPLEARDGTIRVLWNSNIIDSKGFFHVAEAVQFLRESLGLDCQLVAVGRIIGSSGSDIRAADARLKSFESSEWFTYLGSQPSGRVATLLAGSTVVPLPSSYPSECQPLALIEAMCQGRGVVALRTAALAVTVGDYPAVFVDQVDAQALAEALLEADHKFRHEKLVLRAASLRARARFSADRFAREFGEYVLGLDGLDLSF